MPMSNGTNNQMLRSAAGQPSGRSNAVRHFDQADLARRWRLSPRTLERWRWLSQGPAYIKAGGRVVYRLEDIEAYEAAQRRAGQ